MSRFPSVSIVKALAEGWKVIDSTVTLPESVNEVCVEVLNVAVSPGFTGALGDVDQLVPVFQSPEPGSDSQTASRASDGADAATNSASAMRSAWIEVTGMPVRFSMKEVKRCVSIWPSVHGC